MNWDMASELVSAFNELIFNKVIESPRRAKVGLDLAGNTYVGIEYDGYTAYLYTVEAVLKEVSIVTKYKG